MRSFRGSLAALALVPILALVGCGGGEEEEPAGGGGGEATPAANSDVSGTVQVTAVWSGAEQESFQAVLDGFKEQYPDVDVRYTSGGDQLATTLATAVEGGNPPDVAVLAQPGLIQEFVDQEELEPLDFAEDTISENFSEDSIKVGTFNDQLYGLFFKGANKSLMWFNTQVLEDAGVEPPATWEEFLQAADTVEQSGVPMHSIAGADGWTLTDMFENLYLRMAGPEKYDQLANHEIPWTDQSVKDTLTEMAKVFDNKDNIAGNALQTELQDGIDQMVNGDAATFLEGDFVRGLIEESEGEEASYGVEPFPSTEGAENYVVGGGDIVVMFNDTPAAQALIEYLATPEAAEAWASRGGFASPNQNMDASVYPDEITRTTAGALAEAEVFRFDMSDLAPAAFGATPGEGEWKILQDFLDDPSNVDRTAQRLERAAARAYE